jgi:hypothetical protein
MFTERIQKPGEMKGLGRIGYTADCCFYLRSSHGRRVIIVDGRELRLMGRFPAVCVYAEFYKNSSITHCLHYSLHIQLPAFCGPFNDSFSINWSRISTSMKPEGFRRIKKRPASHSMLSYFLTQPAF